MNNKKFLDDISKHLEKLPGVGKKTAQRYSYFIVEKMSLEEVEELASDLVKTKKNICHCEKCGILTNKKVCDICLDNYREKSQIMVVKDTKDALAIENTKQYNGLYHILGGLISPLEGIGPAELNIENLENRTKDDSVKEVIISTSFTPSGETTALYLEKILKRDNLIISRIGYGLPAGGDIEYVDELTLKRAIDSRVKN